MPDREPTATTTDPRLDLLTPGSVLIERYTYERVKGKTKGVQWCVHEVGKDGPSGAGSALIVTEVTP